MYFPSLKSIGTDGELRILSHGNIQVITGLLTRMDDAVDKVYVGIVPSGTANAMANELDGYHATSHVRWSLSCMHTRWFPDVSPAINCRLSGYIGCSLFYFSNIYSDISNIYIDNQLLLSLTGNAALAVAEGRWRYVDILRVTMPDRTIYGLVRGEISTSGILYIYI